MDVDFRPEAAQLGGPPRCQFSIPCITLKWRLLTQAGAGRVQDGNKLLGGQFAHQGRHQVLGPPAVELDIAQLCRWYSKPAETQDALPHWAR